MLIKNFTAPLTIGLLGFQTVLSSTPVDYLATVRNGIRTLPQIIIIDFVSPGDAYCYLNRMMVIITLF